MHHRIPICTSCKAILDKQIRQDGGLVVQYLDALRVTDSPSEIASLSASILKHAAKLVPYEDLRLKTIEPTPSTIMHRVRVQNYNDLFPELFTEDDAQTGLPKPKHARRNMLFWGGAMVVLVIGVGLVGLWERAGSQPLSSGGVGKNSDNAQPLEVLSSHWRAVIVHTPLKQGTYYNILLYYRGTSPMPSVGHLTINWGGATSTSALGGKSLQPEAKVGAFTDVSLPSGLAHLQPMKVNWTEQGKKYAETVRLSEDQTHLTMNTQRLYSGGDAQWKVSYEYETLTGKGFNQSYATFVLIRNGKPIGNSMSCTVSSASGSQIFNLQSLDSNTVRLSPSLSEEGYDITGNQAKMTFDWSTGTDAIALHKLDKSES